jgi:1,2-diacylglycerol 3-alpha-glucosyltransferase
VRVAIVCSGLEHVNRGFESASRQLFEALKGTAEVTLFKGSGQSGSHELVIPCIRRDRIQALIGLERAHYWEQASFAAALYPLLIWKKFDIVHYCDGAVGNALFRMRAGAGGRFKLVLCNSAPYRPANFREGIHVHQVSAECFQVARNYGIRSERMHLIPYGINPGQFERGHSDSAREAYGIPKQCGLVVSLAALNKAHKRIDYLIREVARAEDKSLFLCVAGEPSPDASELLKLAAQLLAGRHRILTIPRHEIPRLLSAADVFVLPSLGEGFGMVLLEALASTVPVIAHSGEHFRWLLGDAAVLVDMQAEGALCKALEELQADRRYAGSLAERGHERVARLFSWSVLVPQYLAMYEDVLKSA